MSVMGSPAIIRGGERIAVECSIKEMITTALIAGPSGIDGGRFKGGVVWDDFHRQRIDRF